MPASVKDRFTVDFEKLFFFTKNKKYYFDQQFEDFKDKDARQLADTYDSAEIIIQGNSNAGIKRTKRPGMRNRRNKRSVWKLTLQPFLGAHFAVFPEKLVETPVKGAVSFEEGMETEFKITVKLAGTRNFAEGIKAFLEKRNLNGIN